MGPMRPPRGGGQRRRRTSPRTPSAGPWPPPIPEGRPALYSYFGTDQHAALFWLAVVFFVLVVAVARLRGFMAMVYLAFTAVMVTAFMLPALLAGEPGVWVAVMGASAITYVVLYLTHGVSLRTSSALAGTLVGVGITALVGQYAIGNSRLTGIADESDGFLAVPVTTVIAAAVASPTAAARGGARRVR